MEKIIIKIFDENKKVIVASRTWTVSAKAKYILRTPHNKIRVEVKIENGKVVE